MKHLALNTRSRQQGAVMVLVTIALLTLLAMVGLALDGGHMLLSKTRLQNAVDAAALSGARIVADYPKDASLSTVKAAATAAATATFLSNLGLPDNAELNDAYAGADFYVEFSSTLNPFNASGGELPFVRVRAENMALDVWLMQLVGFNDKVISASAVAGPIGLNASTCDVLPILACGCDPDGRTDTTADDCADPNSYFGYPDNNSNVVSSLSDISVIKLAAGSGSDVGPGNFRLLRLDGTGGNDLRDALAGVANQCASVGNDQSADTEPGNKSGPVGQGLNTRLGIYNGPIDPADAPADWVTTFDSTNRLVMNGYDANGKPVVSRADGSNSVSGLFDYQDYLDQYANNYPNCSGEQCKRRELVLPIGDCTGATSGTSEDVHIYTVGCFFLMQDVNVGNDAEVFGQFFSQTEGCDAIGTFTSTPSPDPVPIKIVLFRDADSGDS